MSIKTIQVVEVIGKLTENGFEWSNISKYVNKDGKVYQVLIQQRWFHPVQKGKQMYNRTILEEVELRTDDDIK